LGAFDVLLSRYSGQTDIVVGSPIAGRSWYELDGLIGLFVNTVALRTDLADNPTFSTLLTRVRRTTLDSQANQDLPFERLVESLRPDRTLSHAPVFQVMFNMTPIPDRTRNVAGVRMRNGRLQDHGVSTFDLTLNVGERADGLDLVFEYDRDLFDRQTIEQIATHFDYLLNAIVDTAETPVAALPLWPPEERAVLLDILNSPVGQNSNVQSDGKQSVHAQSVLALFESWVDRQPAALAVECEHIRLTYAELDRQANCVAGQLHAFGIEPGAYIAVCLERSVDLLVAVLGVLKAGCAYVPLDAGYPAARLADMFTVVQPRALITQVTAASALSFVSVPTILLDEDRVSLMRGALNRPDYQPLLTDPAYALFTSGSTGTPKAVAVTHGNLAAIFSAWQDTYALTADDRHLQMASFSFDVFTGDWVRALCSGGSLVLCPRFDLLEPARLFALLRDRHVTCAEFVPVVLRELLAWLAQSDADLAFMRLIAVGSDSWYGSEYAALATVAGPHTRVINSYGTAETTIDSIFFEALGDMKKHVMDEGFVPIGRPFAGSRVYVCDPGLRLVPPGVPGELCIGGAGVASGYIGEPELTAERFITDPFVPGGRLYRTGDRARYHSDGTLVLLGRMDRQVKLRGFRIELGDIEAALSRQPDIAAAAVIIDNVEKDRRLVAFIVPASGPISIDALRVALRGLMPDYMVPALFVELDTLPITSNGKVDRNRLPVPEQVSRHATACVEPSGPVEAVLLELYRDVLGISDIGVHDSFFDRGGHSLLATQLVSRIRDVLNTELPLRALFEDPTIAGLVAAIGRQVGGAPPPLHPLPRHASYTAPVSLMQQRLWFLALLEPDNPAYHLHWSVRLTGALDRSALSQAVDALVARHDSLRTTIGVPERAPEVEPLQHIAGRKSVRVEYLGSSRRLEDLIALPFDLSSGPLLRVHLLESESDQHILLLVIHHIIADGWSLSVLFDELSQAYNAYRCDEVPGWEVPGSAGLPVQYADYAIWQRKWLTGTELARQTDYWCNHLAEAPELLELPIDRPRPALQTHAGAWFELTIPAGLTAALHGVGRAENCTLFMVLMAAFDIALARFAGTTDVIVGTPIAGRSRTELEGLIGFFVNTLVIRASVDGNPTIRELLGRVKQTALDAYAHQDLPFEKLV
ncbi:MAG: amino acid adenylation domain-containing protein, partial [Gammaproteobacteria bacterium]|nr:amino acid adenylation domain-containing protein [Gammaproteobacteria bacterium]